jgi:ribosomal protein S18 acetylase RimI-like enzyme
MQEDIRIYRLTVCDEAVVAAVKQLLSQLVSSPVECTAETLRAILESDNSAMYVAEYEGRVCGMITLARYHAPTGIKQWIEDVVVDSSVRGKSVGRRLVLHAIEQAKEFGGTLMLTSRPSRVAANNLYRSLEFESKETNVYKMKV